MSQPVVVYWAPAVGNEAVIASLQTLTGAGKLALNSNQRNSDVSTHGPYVYDKVVRTVSLTSANNLSARNFTISGIGCAVDVGTGNPTEPFASRTEVVPGPNGPPAYSTKIWKQIDSITVDGAVTGVRAGFGSSGMTEYIMTDCNRIFWALTYQMQLLNRSTLTYTVYETLTKYETPNPQGYLDASPAVIPAFGVITATANRLGVISLPVSMVWATIGANTTTAEAAYFTVVQQGIRS